MTTRFLAAVLPVFFLSVSVLFAADEVILRGFFKPVEQVTLSSRAKGTTSFVAEEGAAVQAGEVLMRLEDSLERINLEQQRTVLEKRAFEAQSVERLSRDRAISEDQAMTARVNLELARLQVAFAEAQLERTTVSAPFSGYISRRYREPGEAVDEFIPLLTLVNFSEVLLEAHVHVDAIARVREGLEVEVLVSAFPDEVFQGRVSFVAPVVDPATHEFLVRVRVANDKGVLRPGMRASGSVRPSGVAQVKVP